MKRYENAVRRMSSAGYQCAVWWRVTSKLVLGLAILLMSVDHAGADSRLIFPGQQMLYGKRISEWSARWAQLVVSFPQAENPLDDISEQDALSARMVQYGFLWVRPILL